MKALASVASIAIIIVCAAPSHAQKGAGGAQASVSGKRCYESATSRGWRPGTRGYISFMRECKAGKISL